MNCLPGGGCVENTVTTYLQSAHLQRLRVLSWRCVSPTWNGRSLEMRRVSGERLAGASGLMLPDTGLGAQRVYIPSTQVCSLLSASAGDVCESPASAFLSPSAATRRRDAPAHTRAPSDGNMKGARW